MNNTPSSTPPLGSTSNCSQLISLQLLPIVIHYTLFPHKCALTAQATSLSFILSTHLGILNLAKPLSLNQVRPLLWPDEQCVRIEVDSLERHFSERCLFMPHPLFLPPLLTKNPKVLQKLVHYTISST